MRRDEQIGRVPQRVVRGQRFRGGHIQRGAGQLALLQHPDQGGLMDNAPARDDDEKGLRLQQGQFVRPDHPPRLGGDRDRHHHHVRLPQQRRHAVHQLQVGDIVGLLHRIDVDCDDIHLESGGPLRDLPADIPQADDAHLQTDEADQPRALGDAPLVPLLRLVKGTEPARQEDQHPHRMLRDRGGVRAARIADCDVPFRQLRRVAHPFHASAGRLDPAQVGGSLQLAAVHRAEGGLRVGCLRRNLFGRIGNHKLHLWKLPPETIYKSFDPPRCYQDFHSVLHR